MKKLIIEVALNETVTRLENQHVPLTPEEIAEDAYACFREGATIVHFHNRNAGLAPSVLDTALNGSAEHYAETIRLIRQRCDVIPYPTYTYPGTKEREAADLELHPHVRALREMPDIGLETFVLTVGATNMGRYDRRKGSFVGDAVSSMTHTAMAEYLDWCRRSGLKLQFMVREPGHMRHLAMYYDLGLVEPPVVVHLNFADAQPWGPSPTAKGILSLVEALPSHIPCEWFAHNYTTYFPDPEVEDSHRLLNVLAVGMGGHARTGIGDKPVWDGRQLTNAQMVAQVRAVAEATGREIATTEEARAMLGFRPPEQADIIRLTETVA